MLSFFGKIFDQNQKEIDKLMPVVAKINSFEPEIQKLTDDKLTAKTAEFKNRLVRGEILDDLLPEAFAVAREAIKRIVNERAFDVQLLAAATLHKGRVAEQKTGEGKTLAAAVTAYLNGLSGKGVHVVTVNDYLARRDSGWYGRALNFLGLKVACIIHEQAFLYDESYLDKNQTDERLAHLRPVSRKDAYSADITYGTNNEFGFDYLRDNLAVSLEEVVQPAHHFAIVDEVDSILIDEARTPLIISAPDTEPTRKYYEFASLIQKLSRETDYTIDEKSRTAGLTEHGLRKVEKMLGVENLYEKDFDSIHHIENALKAKTLFIRDKDYIVKDNQVVIVDEFTGRLMHGRRWSEGLHQAVEAKEGVQIQQESRTLASISFQNYFRMYEKLAGMTGTAATEAEEFQKIYKLETIVIPTNKAMVRKDNADVVYKTQRAKYAAIGKEIEECFRRGQPVLVGTTSIEKNEIIDDYLTHKGIPHQTLNAKYHEKEAQIIAKAGEKAAVTVATNMAGRGVDIILGGTMPKRQSEETETEYKKRLGEWQKKHDEVVALGGLHVIGTERHESRRIDNQLRGRSGRQGDPGSSRFFVALDDDLMRIFGGDQIASLMTRFNMPEDIPLEHPMVSRSIEQAQTKVEGFNFDVRKRVVEYDDVMNKQREVIYKMRRRILENGSEKTEAESESGGENLEARNSGGKDLKAEILEEIDNEISNLVAMYSPEGYSQSEYEKIILGLCEIVPFDEKSQYDIKTKLSGISEQSKMSELLRKIVTDIYGQKEKALGEDVVREMERFVYLTTIDKLWMDHLDAVDNLREGIGLRGYAQRDPLVEYKAEAFQMFERLVQQIKYEAVRKIFRIGVVGRPQAQMPKNIIEEKKDIFGPQGGQPARQAKQVPIISGQKVGRNDPCPCGSGKKYKKCHINREPQTSEEREAYNLYETNRDEWNRRFGKK